MIVNQMLKGSISIFSAILMLLITNKPDYEPYEKQDFQQAQKGTNA